MGKLVLATIGNEVQRALDMHMLEKGSRLSPVPKLGSGGSALTQSRMTVPQRQSSPCGQRCMWPLISCSVLPREASLTLLRISCCAISQNQELRRKNGLSGKSPKLACHVRCSRTEIPFRPWRYRVGAVSVLKTWAISRTWFPLLTLAVPLQQNTDCLRVRLQRESSTPGYIRVLGPRKQRRALSTVFQGHRDRVQNPWS